MEKIVLHNNFLSTFKYNRYSLIVMGAFWGIGLLLLFIFLVSIPTILYSSLLQEKGVFYIWHAEIIFIILFIIGIWYSLRTIGIKEIEVYKDKIIMTNRILKDKEIIFNKACYIKIGSRLVVIDKSETSWFKRSLKSILIDFGYMDLNESKKFLNLIKELCPELKIKKGKVVKGV